jgi:hypothetical protein
MSFKVGEKVRVVSEIPGFHQHQGIVDGITQPYVADDRSREDALREMRLYFVKLDDGRHFRFRGKELGRA